MAKAIKLLAMDVDGTLTDGKIYIGASGEVMKSFSVKDGCGIVLLHKAGIKTAIITGRTSKIVEERAKELSITYVRQGISDKVAALRQICEQEHITMEEVAYIGDDLNDIEVLQAARISFAPADAAKQVIDIATNCLTHPGGDGAVRECAEYILEMKRRQDI